MILSSSKILNACNLPVVSSPAKVEKDVKKVAVKKLLSRDAKNENSVSRGENGVLPRIKRKPLDVLQRCGTHFLTFSSSAVATLASIICVTT